MTVMPGVLVKANDFSPWEGDTIMQWKRFSPVLMALCFALVVVLTGSVAAAQQAGKSGNKGSSKTVTGCLQKGDEADEFRLTSEDGKLYDLRSSSVKLGEHVGHKVTVTGSFKLEGGKEENEKEEAKESGQKKPAIFRYTA